MDEDDDLIESLLQNIDCFDGPQILRVQEGNASSPSSNSSSASWTESRVIYYKKRKYQWKIGNDEQRKRNRLDLCRFQRFSFPKIVKNDIRRKYSLMYANVMNSYDYNLVSAFFRQFMIPNVQFEKRYGVGIFPPQKFAGLDLVMKLFLIILQGSVDKTTRVTDITITQSSYDLTRSAVTCKCIVEKSALYDLSSMCRENMVYDLFQGTPNLLSSTPAKALIKTLKSQIPLPEAELDIGKSMFDPIEGEFVRSRFPRIAKPNSFRLEGYLTFIVNEERWIESIIAEMHKVSATEAK